MAAELRISPTVGDLVMTKFGQGVLIGRYSNWTTSGVIVEIKGENYYLAEEAVRVYTQQWDLKRAM